METIRGTASQPPAESRRSLGRSREIANVRAAVKRPQSRCKRNHANCPKRSSNSEVGCPTNLPPSCLVLSVRGFGKDEAVPSPLHAAVIGEQYADDRGQHTPHRQANSITSTPYNPDNTPGTPLKPSSVEFLPRWLLKPAGTQATAGSVPRCWRHQHRRPGTDTQPQRHPYGLRHAVPAGQLHRITRPQTSPYRQSPHCTADRPPPRLHPPNRTFNHLTTGPNCPTAASPVQLRAGLHPWAHRGYAGRRQHQHGAGMLAATEHICSGAGYRP